MLPSISHKLMGEEREKDSGGSTASTPSTPHRQPTILEPAAKLESHPKSRHKKEKSHSSPRSDRHSQESQESINDPHSPVSVGSEGDPVELTPSPNVGRHSRQSSASPHLSPPQNHDCMYIKTPSPKHKRRSLSLKIAMKSPGLKRKMHMSTKRASVSPEEYGIMLSEVTLGVMAEEMEEDSEFEVQRIPEYERYLNELLAEIDESHPDFEDLMKASARLQNMVKERGEDLAMLEKECQAERVQELFPNDDLQICEHEKQNKLQQRLLSRRKSAPSAVLLKTLGGGRSKSIAGTGSNLSSFMLEHSSSRVSPNGSNSMNRLYIMEGSVQFTAGVQNQERYLFLFNDLLLIAKQKSSTAFKLKHRVRVCEMWTATCLEDACELTKTHDKSFVMGWPTTNVVATFNTPEAKENWFEKLKNQIEEEKAKEQPKNIVLKVINKDMDNYQHTKNITVSNTSVAKDCVKMCVDQFEIKEGEPSDYQLWVVSGKEDSPYPLIGHEQPYAIKMNHLRDAARISGSDLPPSNFETNSENLPPSARCDFVLRHSKKQPKSSSFDESSRTLKLKKSMKRSPIITFFKKATKQQDQSSQNNNVSPNLGKLFGLQLCSLCGEEEILPKPVMDMLQNLFQFGPYITGIFRKSANARSVKELKNKYDSGLEVSLDDSTVLVVGATFKEFLRSLPDCLLQCDMFDDWTQTNGISEKEERTEKVKKYLEKLPKCNLHLLRHFMCILYHIDKKSDENSMNAYNLAVCVGPSLLWPHLTAGTSVHAQASKSVPIFIQFLIENCQEVFGKDITNLFGEVIEQKVRQDSSTDSDSMHSLLSIAESGGGMMRRDDSSSFDSLERDLYNSEIESSPRLPKNQFSPTNLSRDSGLTLSDTQLYDDENDNESAEPRSSYARSHSHGMDYDHSQEQQHGHFIHSFDSGIDSEQPVPPPRKKYSRRTSEPPIGNIDKYTLRHPSYRQAISGSLQASSGYAPHVDSKGNITYLYGADGAGHKAMKHHTPLSKRVSADSLESVEECGEERDSISEIQRNYALHEQSEKNVIKKSASGMHLYLDEELFPGSVSGNPRLDQRRIRRQSSRDTSSPPASPITSESSQDSIMLTNSPSIIHAKQYNKGQAPAPPKLTGSKSIDLGQASEPLVQPNVDFSKSISGRLGLFTPCSLSDFEESPPLTRKAGASSAPSSNRSSPEDLLSVEFPRVQSPRASIISTLSKTSVGSTHSSSAGSTTTLTQEQFDIEVPPPRPPKPGHVANNDSSSTPTRGQQKIDPNLGSPPPKVLLRHNEIRVQMKLASKDFFPAEAVNNNRQQRISAPPDYVEHMKRRSLEQSESDSNLPSFMAEHTSQRRYSLGEGDMMRPEQPPSYQEALHRKSLMQHGMQVPVPQVSEDELLRQRVLSAHARKLYEESLRKLEEQEVVPPPRPLQEQQQQSSVVLKETVSTRLESEPIYVNGRIRNDSDRTKTASKNSPRVSRSKSQNAGDRESSTKLVRRHGGSSHSFTTLHRSNSDTSEHLLRVSKDNSKLKHLTPVHVSCEPKRRESFERERKRRENVERERERARRRESLEKERRRGQQSRHKSPQNAGAKNRRSLPRVPSPDKRSQTPSDDSSRRQEDRASSLRVVQKSDSSRSLSSSPKNSPLSYHGPLFYQPEQQKQSIPGQKMSSTPTNDNLMAANKQKDTKSAKQKNDLGWSVSQLRNLYDSSKAAAKQQESSPAHFYRPNSEPPGAVSSHGREERPLEPPPYRPPPPISQSARRDSLNCDIKKQPESSIVTAVPVKDKDHMRGKSVREHIQAFDGCNGVRVSTKNEDVRQSSDDSFREGEESYV